MLIINGYITIATDRVRMLLDDLKAGAEATRQEPGCLFYDFAMADEAQGLILASERWESQESLDAHLATPGIAAFFQKWQAELKLSLAIFDISGQRPFG